MELECKSCGYEWDYKGQSDYYATCPNCHYKVKIPAEAEVVAPEIEIARFNDEENQLIRELATCEDSDDLEEVYSKYDQEEFNKIKKKVKEKVNQMRNDLETFEEVEEVLEGSNWEYTG